MKSRTELMLLDNEGQRLSLHIEQALAALAPRLRRHFPQLAADDALQDVLEQAGQRLALREVRAGPIEKLHGYAWVTRRYR